MKDTVEINDINIEEDIELDNTYLTFYTYGKSFAINIKNVVQIIRFQKVSSIPEFPDYAIGVINLRGEIIPIIDLCILFGNQTKEYNERTCIIVTNINNMNIGFVVDAVDEVTKINDENISPPPKVIGTIPDAYLKGIGTKNGKKSLMLDIEKVIMEDELNVISEEVRQWKK